MGSRLVIKTDTLIVLIFGCLHAANRFFCFVFFALFYLLKSCFVFISRNRPSITNQKQVKLSRPFLPWLTMIAVKFLITVIKRALTWILCEFPWYVFVCFLSSQFRFQSTSHWLCRLPRADNFRFVSMLSPNWCACAQLTFSLLYSQSLEHLRPSRIS